MTCPQGDITANPDPADQEIPANSSTNLAVLKAKSLGNRRTIHEDRAKRKDLFNAAQMAFAAEQMRVDLKPASVFRLTILCKLTISSATFMGMPAS